MIPSLLVKLTICHLVSCKVTVLGTGSSVQEELPNVHHSVWKVSVQQHASPAWDPLMMMSAKVASP